MTFNRPCRTVSQGSEGCGSGIVESPVKHSMKAIDSVLENEEMMDLRFVFADENSLGDNPLVVIYNRERINLLIGSLGLNCNRLIMNSEVSSLN